jgi:hypothetical protein
MAKQNQCHAGSDVFWKIEEFDSGVCGTSICEPKDKQLRQTVNRKTNSHTFLYKLDLRI